VRPRLVVRARSVVVVMYLDDQDVGATTRHRSFAQEGFRFGTRSSRADLTVQRSVFWCAQDAEGAMSAAMRTAALLREGVLRQKMGFGRLHDLILLLLCVFIDGSGMQSQM
jgi:hypothetical protein